MHKSSPDNVMSRGIFVMEHDRTPFQKFFLRRAQPGTVFQNFFLWDHSMHSRTFFFFKKRKVALVISNIALVTSKVMLRLYYYLIKYVKVFEVLLANDTLNYKYDKLVFCPY
jgi:hypothetical protein